MTSVDQALGQVKQEQHRIEPMLKFFKYDHLPKNLQSISKSFHDLSEYIVLNLPSNAERTVALRKLLEAKDCAVRALL